MSEVCWILISQDVELQRSFLHCCVFGGDHYCSTINLSLKAICELPTLNNKSTAINNLLQLNLFFAFLATQKWQLLSFWVFFIFHLQILIIVSISHRKTCHTYGSISPGQGKWSKCGIFLFFWTSAVTKWFDFFNFSQLFWRDFAHGILKVFSFWS